MKNATVTTAEKTVKITLDSFGRFTAIDSSDYNWLVSLDGKLESAISRAMDSDNGVGVSRDKSVTVAITE